MYALWKECRFTKHDTQPIRIKKEEDERTEEITRKQVIEQMITKEVGK